MQLARYAEHFEDVAIFCLDKVLLDTISIFNADLLKWGIHVYQALLNCPKVGCYYLNSLRGQKKGHQLHFKLTLINKLWLIVASWGFGVLGSFLICKKCRLYLSAKSSVGLATMVELFCKDCEKKKAPIRRDLPQMNIKNVNMSADGKRTCRNDKMLKTLYQSRYRTLYKLAKG